MGDKDAMGRIDQLLPYEKLGAKLGSDHSPQVSHSILGVYAPLSSLIPDLVPKSQRGTASGLMQFFTNAGALGACIVGVFVSNMGSVPHAFQIWAYVIEIGFMLLCVVLVMVFIVKEPVGQPSDEKGALGVSF